MKLRLTEPAANDVRVITDLIALRDPERAEQVAKGFEAIFEAIELAPFQCSPVRRTGFATVRKKSIRPYVVLFEIVGEEIWILRAAHERSDWVSLL